MSTATMVVAPANRAPAIAAAPTPPQPNTATLSPGPTPPVWMAAPIPAITPQPSRPAASGRAGGTSVHWPAATRVSSAKAPIPSAGDRGVPSFSVMGWVALKVAKQYCGLPLRHARHVPQTARQLSTTKAPGLRPRTSGPTLTTSPAASWPSRNGKLSEMLPSR